MNCVFLFNATILIAWGSNVQLKKDPEKNQMKRFALKPEKKR